MQSRLPYECPADVRAGYSGFQLIWNSNNWPILLPADRANNLHQLPKPPNKSSRSGSRKDRKCRKRLLSPMMSGTIQHTLLDPRTASSSVEAAGIVRYAAL